MIDNSLNPSIKYPKRAFYRVAIRIPLKMTLLSINAFLNSMLKILFVTIFILYKDQCGKIIF